jgi:mono/diheme cytochrome c family protein
VKKNHINPSIFIGVLVALSAPLLGQTGKVSVTAVSGESWIRHNHTTFSETSMGKTWDLGPPPSSSGKEAVPWHLELVPGYETQDVTLHGSDLYRLNCQACHGELGHGAPPEINSITGPVQATSRTATLQRMRKLGREMSQAEADTLAKDSKVLLRHRLHLGGTHMPPPTLSEEEIHALVPYLEQLSDVPGAQNNLVVKESSYRVGEHIVKSICHICHNATGPNPDPAQVLEGAIPPLSTLTSRVSLPEFVRKVTSGSTIALGSPPAPFRGRMPVFPFLSQDEAAAAYQYLILYPPQP